MENIKEKLGMTDLYKPLKDMCDLPRKDCIPNTASWFMNLPEFLAWAEKEDKDAKALLVLTGAPNTTKQDAAYAKTLSQACDSKSDKSNFFNDANFQELWDFLRIDAPKGHNLHYLVFDELAGLPEDSLHKAAQKWELFALLRDAPGPQVRILVSTGPETFQGADVPPHGNIAIEDHTTSDIQTYIRHDLDSGPAPTREEAGLQMQKMHRLVEREASSRITRCNAYLASYYADVVKDAAKARAVLRTSFESAAQMLSDDDDDNDWEGYYHMAFVLTHSGDMLNALSAFSLLFPKPSGTNVLSWILEFEEGPVKTLSTK
ncbi:hypothetical protein ACHAPT_013169 [Fusarium lateritium]